MNEAGSVENQAPMDTNTIIEQLQQENLQHVKQNGAQLEQLTSEQDAKNLAYWERNMLALLLAKHLNETPAAKDQRLYQGKPYCGWYTLADEGFEEGWSRVISLANGTITFHVHDDFDLGDLPEIQPNWDGHTTEEKWDRVKTTCGIEK